MPPKRFGGNFAGENMNKEWSEINKEMQLLLRKRDTFSDGIEACLKLRSTLSNAVKELCGRLCDEQYSLMPCPNAKGYHCKAIAYSIWHMARIEDITAHTLTADDTQFLFRDNHLEEIGSPIITTGNELVGDEIVTFSKGLNIPGLLWYAGDVRASTDELLWDLSFEDTKRRFDDEDRRRVIASKCVSEDESAAWLIDYWCGKDVAGIIRMSFTRHLIMHIEAMMRIARKIGIEI